MNFCIGRKNIQEIKFRNKWLIRLIRTLGHWYLKGQEKVIFQHDNMFEEKHVSNLIEMIYLIRLIFIADVVFLTTVCFDLSLYQNRPLINLKISKIGSIQGLFKRWKDFQKLYQYFAWEIEKIFHWYMWDLIGSYSHSY